VIGRDHHGLYAEGARQGAAHARQVADRFHLLQTLREKIEQALGRLDRPVRQHLPASAEAEERRGMRRDLMKSNFAEVRARYDAGASATDIGRELGLSRRRVDKWVRLTTLPDRSQMAPTSSSPALFQRYLARRWAEGCTIAKRLHLEIKQLGYRGCYTHLARFVASWRRSAEGKDVPQPTATRLPRDPASGRTISPQIAAALCMKPRALLTPRQALAVDALKASVPSFGIMRSLAMRFRGLLRSRDVGKLRHWLRDAHSCGVHAMRRFARKLQSDREAVQNAVTEPWSSGPTEGLISRLKTLKRAMGGRAGVELLRARMLPLEATEQHAM